jgi:hypothetical protein
VINDHAGRLARVIERKMDSGHVTQTRVVRDLHMSLARIRPAFVLEPIEPRTTHRLICTREHQIMLRSGDYDEVSAEATGANSTGPAQGEFL